LKLTMELVPKTAWGGNLRQVLSSAQWDTIRKAVFGRDNHRCLYCQRSTNLHCHEVWHYNDETHEQTLQELETVCSMCHHIKHFGYAEVLFRQKTLDKAQVILHFCRVNQCCIDEFYRHRQESFKLWAERSKHPWTTTASVIDHRIDLKIEEKIR
jgi:hypothetical protein